jgi:hypothetical protein
MRFRGLQRFLIEVFFWNNKSSRSTVQNPGIYRCYNDLAIDRANEPRKHDALILELKPHYDSKV